MIRTAIPKQMPGQINEKHWKGSLKCSISRLTGQSIPVSKQPIFSRPARSAQEYPGIGFVQRRHVPPRQLHWQLSGRFPDRTASTDISSQN